MVAEINQNSKYCVISLICGILIEEKKVELIETKSRMIVAMGWCGEMGDVDQRVQISFKMNKLWESNVQHGDMIGFRCATLLSIFFLSNVFFIPFLFSPVFFGLIHSSCFSVVLFKSVVALG